MASLFDNAYNFDPFSGTGFSLPTYNARPNLVGYGSNALAPFGSSQSFSNTGAGAQAFNFGNIGTTGFNFPAYNFGGSANAPFPTTPIPQIQPATATSNNPNQNSPVYNQIATNNTQSTPDYTSILQNYSNNVNTTQATNAPTSNIVPRSKAPSTRYDVNPPSGLITDLTEKGFDANARAAYQTRLNGIMPWNRWALDSLPSFEDFKNQYAQSVGWTKPSEADTQIANAPPNYGNQKLELPTRPPGPW